MCGPNAYGYSCTPRTLALEGLSGKRLRAIAEVTGENSAQIVRINGSRSAFKALTDPQRLISYDADASPLRGTTNPIGLARSLPSKKGELKNMTGGLQQFSCRPPVTFLGHDIL